MKELWVEKYLPQTVDGYVFRDEAQRFQVKTWIKDKTIPSRYFPEMLELERRHWQNYCPNELELNDLDILEINASQQIVLMT